MYVDFELCKALIISYFPEIKFNIKLIKYFYCRIEISSKRHSSFIQSTLTEQFIKRVFEVNLFYYSYKYKRFFLLH